MASARELTSCRSRPISSTATGVLAEGREAGLLSGLPLGNWFPDLEDCFLVAVTEKRTREEIETLAECLTGARDAAALPA